MKQCRRKPRQPEATPGWLRFLERQGLRNITHTHAKVLEDLRPLQASLVKVLESIKDDPTPHRNLQAWPAVCNSSLVAR